MISIVNTECHVPKTFSDLAKIAAWGRLGLLHKMRDENGPGSPLHHMAKSLEQVIDTWDGINLFECFTRNRFYIDPDYEFRPEQDYLHDIRLMKHHLKCHRSTIKELDRWR